MNNPDDLAVLILAAGLGSRLRPTTLTTPKPLVPLSRRPMIEWVLDRIPLPERSIAVNTHYLSDQISEHFQDRGVHISYEPQLLGSAGAVANLRSWIAGRDLLIHNADAWVEGPIAPLWESWDRREPRLLVKTQAVPSDFGKAKYIGVSLLPSALIESLPVGFSGLYEQVWEPAFKLGKLQLKEHAGQALDCGTFADLELARTRAQLIEQGVR